MAFQVVPLVKNLLANAADPRDLGSIPELGRSPGEGNGYPLQYSFLGNPMGQRSLASHSAWGLQRVKHDRALVSSSRSVMAASGVGRGKRSPMCHP